MCPASRRTCSCSCIGHLQAPRRTPGAPFIATASSSAWVGTTTANAPINKCHYIFREEVVILSAAKDLRLHFIGAILAAGNSSRATTINDDGTSRVLETL